MAIATLQEAVTTMSSPPYTIARWSCPADSTSLIELEIPAVYHSEESYRTEPRTKLTARAYAIKLVVFNISCDSTSFDISILTKVGSENVESIYEIIKYSDINKSHIDQSFTEFVIRNCDNPVTNKLYLSLTDNDVSASPGTLEIQLTYITLQDRTFENVLHG
jgi:hypothetical protein